MFKDCDICGRRLPCKHYVCEGPDWGRLSLAMFTLQNRAEPYPKYRLHVNGQPAENEHLDDDVYFFVDGAVPIAASEIFDPSDFC